MSLIGRTPIECSQRKRTSIEYGPGRQLRSDIVYDHMSENFTKILSIIVFTRIRP